MKNLQILIACLLALTALYRPSAVQEQLEQPNILWITTEDMDPNLGAYGDDYATTPNLDRLASRSVRYTNAFASAPVCSPARFSLITGVWPNGTGTVHLRNRSIFIPENIRPFPEYMRANGYYCTNNRKMDYNYDWPDNIWNESSGDAHWRNRPDPDQPFFSVFNFTITHQSRVRHENIKGISGDEKHDPDRAPVPPYYPDTPVVREDIATHYDSITAMDKKVGKLLEQLNEDGLMDETIVFFYSDHGRGMPRHKRWLHDSGLHVPLLIHFPDRYKHLAPAPDGETVDRLVSFVDFAPTVLSLVGREIPDYMQGTPFLGKSEGTPREYVHATRDRVDEVFELSRSVRDKRYLYIRNYLPHRPSLQYSNYSERTGTRKELRRLAMKGKLNGPAEKFMHPHKPAEELYDTRKDPHNVNNLVNSDKKEHLNALDRLRTEYRRWSKDVRDVVLLPEPLMLRRARTETYRRRLA